MKRLNRQEMLDIVVTLHKANRLAVAAGAAPEQVITILTKCQDSAITLGEALERYGEVGEQIIHMLEEYCEALYQQSQFVGNAEIQREFQSGIAALLGMVEDKIKNELPEDKKVAVFLPYKASMWDSLESVWKAATEDPDCDAYVVPIPYFDRNPDHSFGEIHYEGNQYPDYVPVYSWEEFNLPDMKPDMVFIHNPYDEYNFVTSIHPAFYVPELRKYAKQIIYIPYFVIGDVDITRPEAEEKMRMFALQPGVLSTDKVIVESEQVKDAYVHVLVKEFGEEHRRVWEEKILPLGSPKFDKLNSTTEEDFDIPEEWKPVLFKEDGSRRKTILYNTSVSALLKHDEKMLAKMKAVFQTFYENREEVALLWRPHPLIKATIESLRPKLWEEYEKLVNEYCSASWGIYDDTADLNRALELADAYYGDGSSLVKLCQEKGMPVMIQDVEEISQKIGISYIDAVDVGEEIWFSAVNYNGLFKINPENREMEMISVFAENSERVLYSKVFRYNNRLIFVPFNAKKIAVYDMATKELTYCDCNSTEDDTMQYFHAIQEGQNIYMFPCSFRNLICFNAESLEVKFVEVLKEDEKHNWARESVAVYKGGCKCKESLYIASFTDDFVLKFNLNTTEYDFLEFPLESKGISDLMLDGRYLWVIGRNGKICKHDIEKRENVIFLVEEGNERNRVFNGVVFDDKKIYLAGAFTKKIYVFDVITNQVTCFQISCDDDEKKCKFNWSDVLSLRSCSGGIEILNSWDGKRYSWNKHEIQKEEMSIGLIELLKKMKKREEVNLDNEKCGREIYKTMN